MAHKLTISIGITNEEGQEIVKTTSEKEVPSFEEFEELGFRKGLHEIETAILEARKEAGETAAAEYMTQTSKKKRNNYRLNIRNLAFGKQSTPTV